MAIDPIAETINALEGRLSEHRKRLESNPDFKAIETLEWSIRKLKNGSAFGVAIGAAEATAVGLAKYTQPAAARKVILDRGQPVPSAELLQGVLALGVSIGGENKQRNLTSILSTHKDFRSVPWKGGSAWWLMDRDVPKGEALI